MSKQSLIEKLIPKFIESCIKRGVDLKWFGNKEPKAFTSRYDSWTYLRDLPVLDKTLLYLSRTIDMRIPLTFTKNDCLIITQIIESELERYRKR